MGRFLLFAVVSFAMGSCVSGEDIAKDFFEEVEKIIEGIQGDTYDEVGENEEDVCSDPVFTRTETLGLSQHAIVPGYVWDCQMDNGAIVYRAYMDGTYVGRYVSDYEIQAALDVWNVCHVGPRPPDISGNWVFVYDDNGDGYVCLRDDAIPGVALCQQVVESPSPDAYYIHSVGPVDVYQYGFLQATIDYQLQCVLAQE